MLLRTAIQHAKSWAGVEQIHLAVTEVSQDARRLYERHGFGCGDASLGRCAGKAAVRIPLTWYWICARPKELPNRALESSVFGSQQTLASQGRLHT